MVGEMISSPLEVLPASTKAEERTGRTNLTSLEIWIVLKRGEILFHVASIAPVKPADWSTFLWWYSCRWIVIAALNNVHKGRWCSWRRYRHLLCMSLNLLFYLKVSAAQPLPGEVVHIAEFKKFCSIIYWETTVCEILLTVCGNLFLPCIDRALDLGNRNSGRDIKRKINRNSSFKIWKCLC